MPSLTLHIDPEKIKLVPDPSALTAWVPIYEYLFELDLTTAHANLELFFPGAISNTIVEAGDGVWSFSYDHISNVRYQSAWFQDMDLIWREFNRMFLTNTAQQDKTNPTFLIGMRLRPAMQIWQL